MEIQPLGAVPIRTDAARQSPDGSTAQRRAPQEVSEAADSRIATVFIPFEDFTASISLRGSKSFRHCRSSLSRPSAPAPLALRRISDNGRAGRIARSAAERSGTEHISASPPHPPDGPRTDDSRDGASRMADIEPVSVPASHSSVSYTESSATGVAPRKDAAHFFGKETGPDGGEGESDATL